MIEVKKIKIPLVELFDNEGNHLGEVNEYQFLDIRVQIKKAQQSGYYAVFDGEKIHIDRNGELENYPDGMFDQLTNLYLELI